MIYFAQPTNGGPIRIGCTGKSLNKRRVQLGAWIIGGVEMVATYPGTFFTEAVLHRVLDPIRVETDWFRSCPLMWREVLLPILDGVQPWWLPEKSPWTQDKLADEVIAAFGSMKAAVEPLGYLSATNAAAAARTNSSNGYSMAARLWVHYALMDTHFPAALAALHAPVKS